MTPVTAATSTAATAAERPLPCTATSARVATAITIQAHHRMREPGLRNTSGPPVSSCCDDTAGNSARQAPTTSARRSDAAGWPARSAASAVAAISRTPTPIARSSTSNVA